MLDLDLAEVLEQREHVVVEREQPRLEALDAVLARPVGEAPEQLAADAPVLPLVDHRDRRLGDLRRVAQPHVARDADALARHRVARADRLVVDVVDLGEVREVALAQAPLGAEEAAVARLVAELLPAREEELLVRGLHRPDQHGGAVAQLDLVLTH